VARSPCEGGGERGAVVNVYGNGSGVGGRRFEPGGGYARATVVAEGNARGGDAEGGDAPLGLSLRNNVNAPGHGATITVDTRAGRLRRMRRAVLTSARLLEADAPKGGFRYRPAMLTLTYRAGVEWGASHVRDCLRLARAWAKRKGFTLRYVWVAELQQRGAVHYHVVVWLPFRMPMPDRCGWWPHGATRVEWARCAVAYLAKYASKGQHAAGTFPKGCRIHGAGGLSEAAARCRRWWLFPREVREVASPSHDVRRLKGGGFVARSSGEVLPPLWGLVAASAGAVRLVRLRVGWERLSEVRPLSLLEVREQETGRNLSL
jgi:hypothetical protein